MVQGLRLGVYAETRLALGEDELGKALATSGPLPHRHDIPPKIAGKQDPGEYEH
jgi:hypothetical protein